MKTTGLILLAWMAAAALASANELVNPGFDQGANGLDNWEGFDLPGGTGLDPTNFVTAVGGSAAVRGYSAGETAFFQVFTAASGALPSGTYTWSADISNLTDPAATMFIKVWEDDGQMVWDGAKYQNVALSNGTMNLTYEHDASDYVQFGFSCYSGDTNEGFTVTSPSVTLDTPGPAPVTLAIASAGGAFEIRFASEDGLDYTLEYTTAPAAVPVTWTPIDNQTGDGGTLTLTDAVPTDGLRLYRVVTP